MLKPDRVSMSAASQSHAVIDICSTNHTFYGNSLLVVVDVCKYLNITAPEVGLISTSSMLLLQTQKIDVSSGESLHDPS